MPSPDRFQFADGDIELNANREKRRLTVSNTGDRAIQVGSHYHLFEANRALRFDRAAALGMHLDLPAGTAVRFEPGDTHEVQVCSYGGRCRIFGFCGLVEGDIASSEVCACAIDASRERGFLDTEHGGADSAGGRR